MKILIIGSAGFIGYALTLKILELGQEVVGIDNDYHYTRVKSTTSAKKSQEIFLNEKK